MRAPSILRQPGSQSFSYNVPPQTFTRITQIRELVNRALDEVQTNRKLSLKKPLKRNSDESS